MSTFCFHSSQKSDFEASGKRNCITQRTRVRTCARSHFFIFLSLWISIRYLYLHLYTYLCSIAYYIHCVLHLFICLFIDSFIFNRTTRNPDYHNKFDWHNIFHRSLVAASGVGDREVESTRECEWKWELEIGMEMGIGNGNGNENGNGNI